jgi:hypothetical protein
MTSIQMEIRKPYTLKNFNKLILDAVDYGLASLGNSSKKKLYILLEEKFQIKKEEIPEKIYEFTHAIEEIFGFAAKIIEIKIMECFYKQINSKFTLYLKETEFSFPKYLEEVKEELEETV